MTILPHIMVFFFIKYQFKQEGMHQIIVRINAKNGGVALASFGIPVLFPE